MRCKWKRNAGKANCLPEDINNSSNITFANLYLYRVASNAPFPYAVKARLLPRPSLSQRSRLQPGSSRSTTQFSTKLTTRKIRSREIASLNISVTSLPPTAHESPVWPPERKSRNWQADSTASMAHVDATGNVYFIDARFQRIYAGRRKVATYARRDSPSNQLVGV